MTGSAHRAYGTAIALALLVVMAGCAGPFQSGDEQTETVATETATATPTATETATTETTSTDESEAATGRLLLLLDGRDTHVDPSVTNESDGVWINESDTHTWHAANESMSLAAALATLGVNASAESLTYENETYQETNGTTVAYRVDGAVVEDPESYRIEDGDELFVTVHTSNVTMPGRKYSSSHPHSHGTFEATVDGDEINFSRERYTMNDDYFHFHGDEDGGRWHAHSMNLTAEYAISSFDDFDLSNGSFTHNGTTYGSNRTVVTVNDEPVDPEAYVLKDGDDLELVVNETG